MFGSGRRVRPDATRSAVGEKRVFRLLRIVILVGPLLFAARALGAERPNLLILAIDTLRADALGCYGHERPTSPGVDHLAAEGARFEQAMSTSPWTLPSFATMFTGRYPTRHGAGLVGTVRNLAEDMPYAVTGEAPTLAEVLQRQGYQTAAVTSNPYLMFGLQRGFASFACKSIAADRVGALARRWLARNADEAPFFLFCHFNDPHEPTDTADAYLRRLGYGAEILQDPRRGALERWGTDEQGGHLGRQPSAEAAVQLLRVKRALYEGAVLQVDLEIARIVETLDHLGLRENTLVVVVSDHGEEFLDHVTVERELGQDPRGLYGIGHGHTLFQELLRVPLILVGPGVQAGQVISEQFSLVDLMPTLLGLLDVPSPGGPGHEVGEVAALDGQDRRAWIEDPQRKPLWAGAEAMAYGPDLVALSDGRTKLVCHRDGTCLWAFDLERDPREETNLLPTDGSKPLASALEDWTRSLDRYAPALTHPTRITDSMREGLKSLGYLR